MIDNLNEILDNLEILIDCKNIDIDLCCSNTCKHHDKQKKTCTVMQLYKKYSFKNKYNYSISFYLKTNIWDNKNHQSIKLEEIKKLKNLKSL